MNFQKPNFSRRKNSRIEVQNKQFVSYSFLLFFETEIFPLLMIITRENKTQKQHELFS